MSNDKKLEKKEKNIKEKKQRLRSALQENILRRKKALKQQDSKKD